MAFTVEDGTIVADATSYVTLAYADGYFAIDINASANWSALVDADKEKYLMAATRILDQKVRWKGVKVDETSALRWPRSGVYDRDNILIDDTEIPDQLKEVVCEMAKYLLSGEDPTVGIGAEAIKRIKADVVEVEYQDGMMQTTVPSFFHNLLRGIGSYPSAFGHQFQRIIKV
jgi:hypothetical protein